MVISGTRLFSDDGHRWSVKLDIRDLGCHLDTTFHGWSSTLASRVRLVISRLVLVFALPLDFHGRLRVLRSMFIPGVLHGVEASFLAGIGVLSFVLFGEMLLMLVRLMMCLFIGTLLLLLSWICGGSSRLFLDLLDAILRWSASFTSDVELLHLWGCVVRLGSLGSVRVEEYVAARTCGVGESRRLVAEMYGRVSAFIRGLVAHRRNVGITAWRNWIREDPLVHPYRWLRADLVPPSPFLQCDRALTPGGSGVLADPARIDEEFRKAWLPYFCRSGQRETSLDEFNCECDGWLPRLEEFSLPALTGDMLFEVLRRKSATTGSLDGWGWRELKVLPVAWFDGLAKILTKVEDLGVWPDGLLDAYISMIPKVDGDATPLGQRPLSVLPVIYRIWASARMLQLEPWFRSWVPSCVFSAGSGRSSVQAWFTTALDIEEVLSGVVQDDVHIFVADVIKSFDTVDRGILDRVLSSLGLPGWFWHAYFEYHSSVRLWFKLAAGLGQPWTRDGGIPQGCPLSMMFIVALYLPWCKYLAAQDGLQPQLYADNLKCDSRDPGVLLRAARFTTGYVRLVGQESAPSKCVFFEHF